LPATGKRVEVTGVTIFRIVNSKIVEEWSEFDMWGLLPQLGLAPAREQ
jgi:predicted ester cyclase